MRFISAFFIVATVHGCTIPRERASEALRPQDAVGAEDGERVRVKGYVVFESHARQLWASEHAYRRSQIANCLTLVNTEPFRQTLLSSSRSVVIINGRIVRDVTAGYVDYGACGPTGLFIETIERLR